MYIHDRRRLLTPSFPNIILDHRTPLAVSPGIVSLQEKNKRRYGDDRRRHRRGGSAHGFSALHGQVENPLSPHRVVTYRVPSRKLRVTFKKTTVSNSHACTSMWYIVTRGAKISIYLPDVRKNILLSVAVPFFFTLLVTRR